jgi:branched-chain amino acid aminotransferase
MPIPKTKKIWHNGKFIEWDDANVHVLSHVVSYGSAVFEGIRCYNTKQGPAIFRLRDHIQRLWNSAYIYRMEIPFTLDELCTANLDLVRENKINECYIRPIIMRGYGEAGVDPKGCPIEVIWLAGTGENTSVKKRSAAEWMCASALGIAPRPTLCRKWPRPPRIT